MLRVYDAEQMTPVVLFNGTGHGVRLSALRSMFERSAPIEMQRLEEIIGQPLRAWTYIPTDDAILDVVRSAYRMATRLNESDGLPMAHEPKEHQR